MKGLLLIFVFSSVLLESCLPKPGHPIEWLHREDSIVVQMKETGGDSMIWFTDRDGMPSFTLYGDGTLIVSQSTTNCGEVDNPCSTRLLESHLPDDSIQGLIDFIDGTGFFDFDYEQPVPPVSGAPTVYLYVNTKLAANAVRANALGYEPPKGDEWEQFRRIEQIRERLDAMAAAEGPTAYRPERGVLFAATRIATDFMGVPEWPYPAIVLPNAPLDEVSQVSLSAEQVASFGLEHSNSTTCWQQVQHASRLYDVCYRPALPYEENFPEFDNG